MNHSLFIKDIRLVLKRDERNEVVEDIQVPVNERLESHMGVFSLVLSTQYGVVRGRFRIDPKRSQVSADWRASDLSIDVGDYTPVYAM